MIRIGILGDIGAGKSYVAKNFGYPVFNADQIVSKIYSKDKNIYLKLKKKIPDFIFNFPIKKEVLINAIIKDKRNIRIISSIVHPAVRKKLKITGSELITVVDIDKGVKPREEVSCEIKYKDGTSKTIKVLCRIDTQNEVEYYKNGGILQYVLRNMLN